MDDQPEAQDEDAPVGHWWRRLALTALDAVDPRTAMRSLLSGDAHDLAHR